MGRRLGTLGALVIAAPLAQSAEDAYRLELLRWRQERESRLKADGGWLTVAGLFWLKEGANPFGTDPGNEIILPAGSAPARAGVFYFRGGRTTVELEPGVEASVDGKPVRSMELKSDSSGAPDVLAVGALQMHVIQRQDRFGLRLKDMNSRFRREFKGLTWFDVDEGYRVTARFVPHGSLKPLAVPNVLGQTQKMPSPGYAVFTIGGSEVRLDGVLEDPRAAQLFFIFRDQTTGKETYPAGRFLYADLPKEGRIVLDFNRAYNPPCAYTPYATCPLPPRENWLSVRIEAGERNYGQH